MISCNLLVRITRAIKEAVFPSRCLVCRSFFHSAEARTACLPGKGFKDESLLICQESAFHRLMSPFMCPSCSTGFLPVESPTCLVCGIMFKSREVEDHVCGGCLKHPKRFRIARAPGVYDQSLMAAIHSLKYKEKIWLARPLGLLLFSAFISLWDRESIDIILPVPLHIKRFRMRGFNQAFLLIKDWICIAEDLNVELPYMQVDRDILVRRRWTAPQTGLNLKKRMTNIKNAFGVSNSARIKEKRILLVDDVYTTGITVNECAKALLHGGAKSVDVLTLARTMYM